MIYGFDTDDEPAATAALLVYAIWRSRDRARLKISTDIWDRVERFTKDAAKRSRTLPSFIEALKPRLACGALKPKWMAVGMAGEIPVVPVVGEDGRMLYAIQRARNDETEPREFLVTVLERAPERHVLGRLYKETAWVVLLVRDRLEREKPVDAVVSIDDDEAA